MKKEFYLLCKSIKDKSISRDMLIAYANSYSISQKLKDKFIKNSVKNTLAIYKYKPELEDKAQYFKSESALLHQLTMDMQDDIKINGTSDEFLLEESIRMGETILLEFSIPQAINTLTELLNQTAVTRDGSYTDCTYPKDSYTEWMKYISNQLNLK
tara:strand:- start:17 stop:484 length:468 start_codon:yes stop_codon:yes gene_type:complete